MNAQAESKALLRRRFVGVVIVLLAALILLGWTGRVAVRRLDALESAVAGLRAGIEPVHSRCEALEVALSITNEGLALAERRMDSLLESATERFSQVEEHAAALADSHSRMGKLESDLVGLEDGMGRRELSIQGDLDVAQVRLNKQEQKTTALWKEIDRLGATFDPLPVGTILPWLPTEDGLPEGWAVCDGTYGTPDLRGLFLRGASFPAEAGRYGQGAAMLPAGRHSHATEEYRTLHSIVRSVPRPAGDWRVLFDTGAADGEPQSLAIHGEHVHEDDHVPAHMQVVFIVKEG